MALSCPVQPEDSQGAILENAQELVRQGLEVNRRWGRLLGIGVSLGWWTADWTVDAGANLKWRDVPIRQIFAERFSYRFMLKTKRMRRPWVSIISEQRAAWRILFT
jgi:hypothetical protein